MKRTIFVFALAVMAVFGLAESRTEAVDRAFSERFIQGGVVDAKGETGGYNFDKAHSFISFRIKHMGLIEVPGFFRDFTGKVNYNADDVTKSSVEFTAKMTSVDTGVTPRDNHLRTADFFEVEKYPEMTFKSTKVEKAGDGWKVTGDLTIKDVTKSVEIPFNITGFIPGGEKAGPRMGIAGETTINRREFNVNYGGNVPGTDIPSLADDVRVVLQIEAIKPKEEPKPAAE
ncbi:MAG TPA: YceI family protein [Pyrinomonadaceae bacterium]|nr:YceI family protein [Pyrinomonadaceae bacterium]